MLTKLDAILKRYQTLSEQLGDPDVLSDTSTWQKLSKEQAELTETAEKYQFRIRMPPPSRVRF